MIIFFTDHKTSKKRETDEVRRRLKELTGIELLQVCIGPYVDIRELEKITEEKQHVIHVGECKAPVTVAREIWHGKEMHFIKRNINFKKAWISLGPRWPNPFCLLQIDWWIQKIKRSSFVHPHIFQILLKCKVDTLNPNTYDFGVVLRAFLFGDNLFVVRDECRSWVVLFTAVIQTFHVYFCTSAWVNPTLLVDLDISFTIWSKTAFRGTHHTNILWYHVWESFVSLLNLLCFFIFSAELQGKDIYGKLQWGSISWLPQL